MSLKNKLIGLLRNKLFVLFLVFVVFSLVVVFAGNVIFKQGDLTVEGRLGVATANPQRALHVVDVMRLEPRGVVPATCSVSITGDIYVDSTPASDELCFCNGVAWQGISSGTDSNCA